MATRRKVRLGRRITDARNRKQVNAIRKHKEMDRRDARMMAAAKAGSLPYTPDVMSWLSRTLGVLSGLAGATPRSVRIGRRCSTGRISNRRCGSSWYQYAVEAHSFAR